MRKLVRRKRVRRNPAVRSNAMSLEEINALLCNPPAEEVAAEEVLEEESASEEDEEDEEVIEAESASEDTEQLWQWGTGGWQRERIPMTKGQARASLDGASVAFKARTGRPMQAAAKNDKFNTVWRERFKQLAQWGWGEVIPADFKWVGLFKRADGQSITPVMFTDVKDLEEKRKTGGGGSTISRKKQGQDQNQDQNQQDPDQQGQAGQAGQAGQQDPPKTTFTGRVRTEAALDSEEESEEADSKLQGQIRNAVARSRAQAERFERADRSFRERFEGQEQFISTTRIKPLPTVTQLWGALRRDVALAGLNEGLWRRTLGKTAAPEELKADGPTGWKYLASGYGGDELSKATGTILLVVRNGPTQSTQMFIPSSTPVVSRGSYGRKKPDTAKAGELYWAPVAEFVSRGDYTPLINAGLTGKDPIDQAMGGARGLGTIPDSMLDALRKGQNTSIKAMLNFVQRWRLPRSLKNAMKLQKRMVMPVIIFKESALDTYEYITTILPRPIQELRAPMDEVLGEIGGESATPNPRRRLSARRTPSPKPKKRVRKRVKRR